MQTGDNMSTIDTDILVLGKNIVGLILSNKHGRISLVFRLEEV